MRSWWWAARGFKGDTVELVIEFEGQGNVSPDIKPLLQAAQLPNLVRAAPEVVAPFKQRTIDTDYYFDEHTYSTFFTEGNRWGPFREMQITNSRLIYVDYGNYGSTQEFEVQSQPPDKLTTLIISLVQNAEYTVKHWKVTNDYLEDGGNYPFYVAEGDHQALIEYLELDNPEQQVT